MTPIERETKRQEIQGEIQCLEDQLIPELETSLAFLESQDYELVSDDPHEDQKNDIVGLRRELKGYREVLDGLWEELKDYPAYVVKVKKPCGCG